jgi:Trypsin-co-occurring domain 2
MVRARLGLPRWKRGTGLVGLAAALEVLREELEDAWNAGEGQRIRFRVSDLTLTMQVVASREHEGGGKLRWYLLEAGGSTTATRETTQTLVLTVTPGTYDDNGKLEPIDVHGRLQPQPGG